MGAGVQPDVPVHGLLAVRPYRLLFAGQALSVVGDRITPVAIAFAVLGLGDATDLGLVLAAGGIPYALFAIVGGVISDRVGRREVMIASDVVRALSQALTAALLLTGTAEVWMLTVLAAVYGTSGAVFMPALMGLIPQTVPPARLQQANAMLGFTRSVATVAGPAFAGVMIAIAGSGEAIALDAVTFAISAGCLLALRTDPAAPEAAADPDPFVARLRAGWREVRARPWLAYGLAAMGSYHVFVLPSVYVLGPVLAARELSGASSWAAIVACFGVGAIVGNLLAMRLRLRRPVLVAAVALVVASTQAAIIGSGVGTAGIAALELLAGIAVSLFFTLWDTTLQEQVPPESVSRVSSYDFTVSLGLMPIGMAVSGPIAAAVGLHATLVGMSALGMLVALLWLAVPAVRRLDRDEPGPAVTPVPADLPAERAVGDPAAPERDPDGPRFERDRNPTV
jgi:MFS family permease